MNACPVSKKERYECAIPDRNFGSFYQVKNFLGRFTAVG